MKFGKIALAGTAMALAATPIASQAIAADRSAAPVDGENSIGSGATIGVLFALAALTIGIAVAADNGNNNPVSA